MTLGAKSETVVSLLRSQTRCRPSETGARGPQSIPDALCGPISDSGKVRVGHQFSGGQAQRGSSVLLLHSRSQEDTE